MEPIEHPWKDYLSESPVSLEVVDSVLWDTQRYAGGGFVTDPPTYYTLNFFSKIPGRLREGNMEYPGMLPNPKSFLIEKIQIKGLTRRLSKNATMRVIIGSKVYLECPLDLFLRFEKFVELSARLMIPSLTQFRIEFYWPSDRYRGADRPKIEIRLRGMMARAIQ